MTGLREHRFDFARQRLRLADNYLVKSGQHIEKPPKDGDGRWVSVDPLTCDLFADWFRSRRAKAAELAGDVPRIAYAFSPEPDGRTPWNPEPPGADLGDLAAKLAEQAGLDQAALSLLAEFAAQSTPAS
jgi:hypothetical protein